MMAEWNLFSQFHQTCITYGPVDVFGSSVIVIVARGKFEGCKAGIKSEMEEGLSWKRIQGVNCKAKRVDQGGPPRKVIQALPCRFIDESAGQFM